MRETKRKFNEITCFIAVFCVLFVVSCAAGSKTTNTSSSNSSSSSSETNIELNNRLSSEMSSTRSHNSSVRSEAALIVQEDKPKIDNDNVEPQYTDGFSLSDVPAYDGSPWYVVNGNRPFFNEDEKKSIEPFETYSELDDLGRCGVAYANICKELMPTEERGNIGQVKPTGWHTVKYDNIDGKYLYNRCHLIGYQLAGENANKKNLITGTRYLNVEGMLPYENDVDDYVERTGYHVLYRVTPIFEGDELVARGVLMEAYSVEGEGQFQFCVFCYNVQPDINIDYTNGESSLVN